jgi:hypothetical protein
MATAGLPATPKAPRIERGRCDRSSAASLKPLRIETFDDPNPDLVMPRSGAGNVVEIACL